ncbi:RNA polymerase sigma-70 factor, ECF subfamily [Cnuella takakiae]|uniref:RNA polymerase sigma-70 factor, ECF subfamily n=1 Tax=Cnuella takakiae TaxID=1302690 RepID=A0A1M5GC29_9BACT|nr:sigma-70 family RNA polymerase sigma factor [Cnuella takakiae]OLY92359.1 RNA polymerase subunit sigma-70 [Cnuella takakiae]SHG01042.1 RNA polymerase sigma-70 factor, ECF subfamily [Cnuella takakiae]
MQTTITYSETELVDRLQAHDQAAFSYLYDHYSKALFVIIYQVVPQQELAEDVLQEVFVKIWQNVRSYDATKGRLYTWMLNIARNSAIDRTRSKDFNRQAKTTELTDNVYEGKDGVHSRIDDIGLKKTIERLPEENRRLLELSYFQGYTQDEIAKMMGIPLGTVKTRIRSTLLQLRKLVGTNR